jgi:HSP20 family protein
MADEKERQPHKDAGEIVIDFGQGKISFGGLFQGIGNVIDAVAKSIEEDKGEFKREGTFSSPSGRVKAVYGISVKTSLAGVPLVESFGNVRSTSGGPKPEEVREPLVDMFDEQNHLIVLIEIPGVEEEQIRTNISGNTLTLSTEGGERKYYKEIALPNDIETSTMESSYKNGVLRMKFAKKDEQK